MSRLSSSVVPRSRVALAASPAVIRATPSMSRSIGNLNYHSNVEQAVVGARTPLRFDTRSGSVQVGPFRGVQLNREEEHQFRGPLPLSQYQINHDPNPELIRKRSANVKYTQEVAVRRLQPPTPPPHGDLIVRERQAQIPAGPPVVLRQEGRRAQTPPPQIYREAPPRPPTRIPTQLVEVEGAPVPPPARKVVFEKLADQPAKPQNILIEKWLPYKPQTRRVVFQRSCIPPPPNPKNLVIEWEQPCVEVEQVCKDLGVERADPEEYVRRFACELKQPHEIPNLCQGPVCPPVPDCLPPTPVIVRSATPVVVRQATPVLVRSASLSSVRQVSSRLQLVGDVDALRRVPDLAAAGLAEYARAL